MFKEKKLCRQEILRVLRSRTETFLTTLKLCYREPEEENVHDLRVAARRLRVTLELLGEIKDFENLKKVNRKIKRVLRIFAELRDIQVQQLFLKDLINQFPELEHMILDLEKREEKESIHSIKEINRLDRKQVKEDLARLIKKVEGNLKKKEVHRALEELIQRDYHRVMDSQAALTLEDVETFHRLRIDCKKFRYRMEIIEPLLVTDTNLGESLRKIQDKLGEIQDLTVLLEEIGQYPELCTKDPINASFRNWLQSRLEDRMKFFYGEREDLFTFENSTLTATKKKEKVMKMSEKDKTKKLCKLVKKKDYLDDNMEEYMKLVGEPKFLCKKCGRAAEKEKQLCKAKKMT